MVADDKGDDVPAVEGPSLQRKNARLELEEWVPPFDAQQVNL